MDKTLKVEGMTCGHCVSAVEGSVGSLSGVESVKVNLDQGQVNVSYDTAQVSEEAIKEAIDDQGFDVVS
ncbi:copper chaperone CopZ [Alkalicoccus chagannorensis]|uniref:copper chaperone CopZ n=1 Tax=Alkalicoccus chagannorensis TaxID=427072 RepID=UPI000422AAC7|nr:copper chaperone CopZ [Alkalicoccus chagannorensis]